MRLISFRSLRTLDQTPFLYLCIPRRLVPLLYAGSFLSNLSIFYSFTTFSVIFYLYLIPDDSWTLCILDALDARDRPWVGNDGERSPSHSINTRFRTTMFNPNRPREKRLKGKFKRLLDRLMGADRLRNDHPRPGGLRWSSWLPRQITY